MDPETKHQLSIKSTSAPRRILQHYSSDIYNSLPQPQDSAVAFLMRRGPALLPTLCSLLARINRVCREINANSPSLGLCLVHRHFSLADDEVAVQTISGTGSTTTEIWKRGSRAEGSVLPTAWAFKKGMLFPFKFVAMKEEMGNGPGRQMSAKVLIRKESVEELWQVLREEGMENVLGVCVIEDVDGDVVIEGREIDLRRCRICAG